MTFVYRFWTFVQFLPFFLFNCFLQIHSKAKIAKNESNSEDLWTNQTKDSSNPNQNPDCDQNNENYSKYYDSYYANYYQHCGLKSGFAETDSKLTRDEDLGTKARTKDLIDGKVVKNRDDSKSVDEDEEEGQIPSSPRAVSKDYSSSSTPSKASSQSTPLDSSARNSQYGSSKSRSVSKERLIKSRSRSRSRRRYISRSRSRSLSRQRRRRSRSRSPYLGPIIKDYRRGRRGFVRYPRGFRDRGMRSFRRGHHSQHHFISYGFARRHEFSRSKSRSFSPKRRTAALEKSEANSDDEKQFDSKRSETLKPSDINMSQKRITQSFLAMLEEKQNRSKMIPIESNRSCETFEGDDNFNKQHGFVNTFNSVREMDARKHTLSYDLEREGWQVIDDANSELDPKRHQKSKDDNRHEEKSKDLNSGYKLGERELLNVREKTVIKREEEEESSSSEEISKKKKKKNKKRKKKRKRKASTSSESSDSESDNENEEDLVGVNKKKAKKKKKTSKKKKKALSTSSSSENDDKEEKHKKKKRKKKKESSSDSESEDKIDDSTSLASNQKSTVEGNDIIGSTSVSNELLKDGIKTKDKKKKKRKTESTSSDSDSDKNEKKKKKKNKKKKSRKRKHRSSSSSSSSESSDSSESGDRKKKKRKKSKKSKKTKKHKKDKKSEKKEKTKSSNEEKKKSKHDEESKLSEFVAVYSVGDPPLELKWPKNLIQYTIFEPSLQYSINPKVPLIEDDFRQTIDDRHRNADEMQRKRKFMSEYDSDNESQSKIPKTDDCKEKLVSEYERFIDELNPSVDFSHDISEESLVLEFKMREKLLKQYKSNTKNDSEEDLVTPSEKRAIERMKKQHLQTLDENEEHRRHEDMKSVPLSTYYSAKKQNKSSPAHKTEDSEKSTKSKSRSESEPFYKTNEISISIGERINKHDSQTSENTSKVDDKKKTARELLERVKQKKHSSKESDANNNKEDSLNNKRSPHIGKIKKPQKKSLLNSSKTSSITTANADSTQNAFVSQPMKLDMNFDYNWYYKYYMNSYAMGPYSAANSSLAAAYYAQYAMLTAYDYNHSDLSNWMQQRGYTLDNNQYINSFNEQNVKSSEEIIDSNQEKDLNLIKTEVSSESNKVEPPSDSITTNLSLEDSEVKVIVIFWFVYHFISNFI
jgi:hypothetical protein